MIVRDFDGKVPNTMEKLLKLAGSPKKTTNVKLLAHALRINAGVTVDTHVKR
jgi:endonuclease-3